MEKKHTQSVVERAYAFVEDMFDLPHGSEILHDKRPSTKPLTPEGRQDDSDAYTMKSVAEVSVENARRRDSEKQEALAKVTKQNLRPADIYVDRPY